MNDDVINGLDTARVNSSRMFNTVFEEGLRVLLMNNGVRVAKNSEYGDVLSWGENYLK